MKKLLVVFLVLSLSVSVVALTTGLFAQTKGEICDNGLDDDGDKLVDCKDPDCAKAKNCQPPDGTPCSPGYWKNHEADFNAACPLVEGWTCDELWEAVNCKGRDSTCRRSDAAAALNAVSGCTE